jgi:GMP synthase (glutamine-hydrolysing)
VAVDAESRFLDRLRGARSPSAQAQDHWHRVHPRLEGRREDRRRPSRGPCTDVIESGGAPARDDQVPPQRRRPARRPGVRVERLRALFADRTAPWAELGRPSAWAPAVPGPARRSGSSAASHRWRLDVLRDADFILQTRSATPACNRELWQSFSPPDIRTVGVQGDERTYGYVVVIRAVTSDDAMTADWARLPYDLLEQIAARMIGELREVNRVVLDITSKPPGTIEWE